MHYLSLFSGIGGGDLAAQHLLGWRCVGYVEWDDYCQRVLRQRQLDGCLDTAPIFGDIRAFLGEGHAERYRGVVDCVTGGPPCQPFSVAGSQKGEADERNMFPATVEAIRIIGPKYVFIENVPGFLSSGYMGRFNVEISKLRNYRFSEYAVLPAYITGSPHVGKRLWNVVSANGTGLEGIHQEGNKINLQPIKVDIPGEFWKTTPRVFRRGTRIPDRVERTRALGNSQCPQLAATAWHLLVEGE